MCHVEIMFTLLHLLCETEFERMSLFLTMFSLTITAQTLPDDHPDDSFSVKQNPEVLVTHLLWKAD